MLFMLFMQIYGLLAELHNQVKRRPEAANIGDADHVHHGHSDNYRGLIANHQGETETTL